MATRKLQQKKKHPRIPCCCHYPITRRFLNAALLRETVQTLARRGTRADTYRGCFKPIVAQASE